MTVTAALPVADQHILKMQHSISGDGRTVFLSYCNCGWSGEQRTHRRSTGEWMDDEHLLALAAEQAAAEQDGADHLLAAADPVYLPPIVEPPPTRSEIDIARGAPAARHARLIAHLDTLTAAATDPVTRTAVDAIRSVAARHFPWSIYTECDCDPEHRDADEPGFVDIEEIGLTCEKGFLYTICAECCCSQSEWEWRQREECADGHNHTGDRALCQTLTGIEGALGLAELEQVLEDRP